MNDFRFSLTGIDNYAQISSSDRILSLDNEVITLNNQFDLSNSFGNDIIISEDGKTITLLKSGAYLVNTTIILGQIAAKTNYKVELYDTTNSYTVPGSELVFGYSFSSSKDLNFDKITISGSVIVNVPNDNGISLQLVNHSSHWLMVYESTINIIQIG